MLLAETEEERDMMLNAILKNLSTWSNVQKSDIITTTLNGLSNKVMLASIAEYNQENQTVLHPEKVVVKLKNKKSVNHPSKCFFKEAEKTILENRYGPNVLYDDSDFQIAEYIRSREFGVEDFKSQAKRVQTAACLAEFTKMKVKDASLFNKEPQLMYLLKDPKNYRNFLDEKLKRDNYTEAEKEQLRLPQSLLSDEEHQYLIKLFESEEWDMRFSHNDIFYANVLHDFDKDKLLLIDYE